MFTPIFLTLAVKISLFAIFISSGMVIVNAVMSAKTLGGELGMGLKKVAVGTIIYVILFLSQFFIEIGVFHFFSEEVLRFYYMVINIICSVFL